MAPDGDIRDFFARSQATSTGRSTPHRGRGRGRGRSQGRGRGRGGHRMSEAAWERRNELRATAAETQATLPDILAEIDGIDPSVSSLHHAKYLGTLDPNDCPGFTLPHEDVEAGRKGRRIRVLDQDSFEAALKVQPNTTVSSLLSPSKDDDTEMKGATPAEAKPSPHHLKPVAVLNLANETHPGGGWLNGALAQEEALCYRSSLSLALSDRFYPIPSLSLLYTPHCIIIRNAMASGHDLLYPSTPATSLPVTSVISVAALKRPKLNDSGGFARIEDVEITKEKIRIVLRIAALKGHRRLVLGAMGCGAFVNPPEDIASCFAEVFGEDEFKGGWWEDVTFAVLDNAKGNDGGKDGTGNFGIFYRALDGLIV